MLNVFQVQNVGLGCNRTTTMRGQQLLLWLLLSAVCAPHSI